MAAYSQTALPLADGEQYAINQWLPTLEGLGLPLHIMTGDTISISFGAADSEIGEGKRTPLTPLTARRVLGRGSEGYIVAADVFDYRIEVWTLHGRRVTGFNGPQLNEALPISGVPWQADNPPANTIEAVRLDDQDRLWVVSWRRKPDWLSAMDERMTPNGMIYLDYKPGESLYSVFTSVVDVIDLNSAEIVAQIERPELFIGFVGAELLETHYDAVGAPHLGVWRVTLNP